MQVFVLNGRTRENLLYDIARQPMGRLRIPKIMDRLAEKAFCKNADTVSAKRFDTKCALKPLNPQQRRENWPLAARSFYEETTLRNGNQVAHHRL